MAVKARNHGNPEIQYNGPPAFYYGVFSQRINGHQPQWQPQRFLELRKEIWQQPLRDQG